jgi:negative regulator of sigma E activity
MEPNNIENQIREKLNSREIQPSSQAWDRLDAMLTVAEEKKTKRSFFSYTYIGIAASVLVLVTLGLFLFNQKESEIKLNNTVVETKIKVDTTTKNSNSNNKTSIQVPAKVSASKQVVVISKNAQPASRNSQLMMSNPRPKNPAINRDKEIEYLLHQNVAQKDMPKVINTKTSISLKEESVVLDDFLVANLNYAVKKKSDKQVAIKVDVKSLLSEVDGEVEQSFREKVLSKINKNYQEVKVALANRNNQ